MLIAFSPARNATMKTYKQLTYEQRCQIYALSKTGMSQNKIAKQLNVKNFIDKFLLHIYLTAEPYLSSPTVKVGFSPGNPQ